MIGGAKPIGGRLQRGDVLDGQKGIIVLAESDLGFLELLFDEGVAVEIIGGLEGQEGGHSHHDRSKHFIVNVEVVVREAAALRRQDAVVGVFGRILRHADPEGRPLFHALEKEIDAMGPLLAHPAQPGQDVIRFADPFLGPLQGEVVVAGKSFHPGLVVGGALAPLK